MAYVGRGPDFFEDGLVWRWVSGRVRHAKFLISGLPVIRPEFLAKAWLHGCKRKRLISAAIGKQLATSPNFRVV